MKRMSSSMTWLALATLVGFAAIQPGCRSSKSRLNPRATINGVEFKLEIADQNHEQIRGLGGRASLPDDQGMLFVFSHTQNAAFHMKDCSFEIDVAFIDETGVIVNTFTMPVEADPTDPARRYRSDRPVRYALETVGGTWERIGATVGMKVSFVDVRGAP